MLDIALNDNHDIDIKGIDLWLVDAADQVRQQLLIKLKLWTGEWFLDTEFGTPYLQHIIGKQLTLSGAVAALKKSISEVEGVRSIQEFTYDFSSSARKLSIEFTVDTEFGLIEVVA